MLKKSFSYFIILFLVFLACKNKNDNKKVFVPKSIKSEQVKIEPRVMYVYKGQKFRDPMLKPSKYNRGVAEEDSETTETTGITETKKTKRASKKDFFSEFHSLTLQGVMVSDDGGSKYAILGSNSGLTYIIKDGSIIDGEGKIVAGATGTIGANSVNLEVKSKKMKREIKI